MAVIFPKTTLPFSENNGAYGFTTNSEVRLFALNIGDYYEVVFDGVTYTVQANVFEYNGSSFLKLGNVSITGLSTEDTGEPFVMLELLVETTYNYGIYTSLEGATHTVTVNSERAINVVLAERVLSFTYDEKYGAYVNNSNPSLFVPVEGETYIIVWDGIEYNSTALTNENFPNQVMIGNPILVGGENTNEPFAMSSLADGNGMSLFSLDTSDTHRLAVYKEVEEENETPAEPTEPEETAGVTITLYDRTGQAVNYDNVETITTDTPDAEQGATFTYGVAVENAEYEPNFANGNQKVALEKGQLLKEFTLVKPETLLPEYIKKNVEVAGVLGEFAGDETEKTVELAMADGDQVIKADEDTVLTKITVKKPETLIPENIANGVNIGGVVGEFAGSSGSNTDIGEVGEDECVITLLDYDGSIIEKVKVKHGTTFTLPDAPEHERLVFDSWSSNVSVVNNTVTVKNQDISVGATYYTASGATEIDIFLTSAMGLSFTFASVLTGYTSIDWGDGTVDTTLTHTYAEAGEYTIKIYGVTQIASSSSSSTISPKTAVAIKRVFFSKDLKTINNYAFYACKALETVVIPKGITSIPNYCFYGCYVLKHITIPQGVTALGQNAFANCYVLETVVLPKGISSIGNYCFSSCYSLGSNVVVPQCSLGTYAFNFCTSVKVYDFSNCTYVPALANVNAFNSFTTFVIFKVPASLYSSWIAATNWSSYANYIVAV